MVDAVRDSPDRRIHGRHGGTIARPLDGQTNVLFFDGHAATFKRTELPNSFRGVNFFPNSQRALSDNYTTAWPAVRWVIPPN